MNKKIFFCFYLLFFNSVCNAEEDVCSEHDGPFLFKDDNYEIFCYKKKTITLRKYDRVGKRTFDDFFLVENFVRVNAEVYDKNHFYVTYIPSRGIGFEITYENGNPIKKIEYVDQKQHGISIEWHDNGIIKSIKLYENDLMNGESIFFDDKGVVEADFYYLNGDIHGDTHFFDGNNLISTVTWVKGKKMQSKNYYLNGKIKDQSDHNVIGKNGPYFAWYETGEQKILGFFKDGKKQGKWKFYRLSGDSVEVIYDDGKIISGVEPEDF